MIRYTINTKKRLSHINKELYGNFSEHLGRGIYQGIYVGEESKIPNVNGMRKDVVDALKEVKLPVLRWPGGCFADEYHWMDGIGPKETRKKMVNTNWGGVVEDNSFGTHEFMELCDQIGCEAYINGNVGSGSIREMSEWVEYLTFDGVSPMAELRKKNGHEKPWNVKYFGIGNENWGCGGNMLPEYYANEYRRYQTYVRQYNPDAVVNKVACGPNGDDYEWTETVLETCFKKPGDTQHGFMDAFSLHYYTIPHTWEHKGSATEFDTKEWYKTLNKTFYMEELICGHAKIMDKYDPEKKIGLVVDEWGTWFDCEPGTNPGFLYQQNTMRDALVAAINLNLFNKHSDRVKMANIAQMVNVLQALILTEGEKMVLTPTYHVFNLYKYHQENTLLDSNIQVTTIGEEKEYMVPNLSESASVDQDGTIHITVANLSLDEEYTIVTQIADQKIQSVCAEILTNDMKAKNTFEEPETVQVVKFNGVEVTENGIQFTIPACSVLHIEVK